MNPADPSEVKTATPNRATSHDRISSLRCFATALHGAGAKYLGRDTFLATNFRCDMVSPSLDRRGKRTDTAVHRRVRITHSGGEVKSSSIIVHKGRLSEDAAAR